MLSRTRDLVILCTIGCIWGLSLSSASAQSRTTMRKVYKLLQQWKADEAAQILRPFVRKRAPKAVTYTYARILYFQGRYKRARTMYKRVLNATQRKQDSTYQSLIATIRLTRGYKELHSPHFIVQYPPGPNAILAPYAIRTLEQAYHKLGAIFGYYPKDRIRVQILRNALELAEMSPLTKGDIVRTGTIALCKYNRVMLTSPHALLRGYRWLDTLIHEYSHLLINRVAAGVPIWLHEGLARYSEILWRSKTPLPLSPYSETLLARGVKKDRLIPFKKMHPSMAKLPSQKDAALAYAQVYELIKYFVQKKGQKGIPQVLGLIQKGYPVPKAFASLVNTSFKDFLGAWKNHLLNSGLREFPEIEPEKKILKGQPLAKQKKRKARKRNFWYKPKSKKELGSRYIRLGEMLRAQGRFKAALIEYLKAETYWKNRDPKLHNKIAISYFKVRKAAKAIPYLQDSLKMHPNYVATYVHLGRAYFASGQFEKARKAFEEVNQINPFHPTSHKYLISIYRKLKRPKAAKQELRIYRMIRGGF